MLLSLTGLSQTGTVTNGKGQAKVSFQLSGDMPKFVQIYAAPAGGSVGSASLVLAVNVPSSQTQYDETITLPADVYTAVYVCPRTGSQQQPDDETDDQPWETYCAVGYITVKSKAAPPAGPLVPPVITVLNPAPATMQHGNQITVLWSSPTQYDKFVLGWTQNGVDMQPQDLPSSPDPSGSGSWIAPTIPGAAYTFRVNGGISQFWNYNYSAWGPTASVTAALPYLRLRAYLLNSDVDLKVQQHLRSLMQQGQTLRSFMKL
jgi:hypothetical protein